MEKALAEGTIDARLFLHAGVLETKLGQTSSAESYLTKAQSPPAHIAPLGTRTPCAPHWISAEQPAATPKYFRQAKMNSRKPPSTEQKKD